MPKSQQSKDINTNQSYTNSYYGIHKPIRKTPRIKIDLRCYKCGAVLAAVGKNNGGICHNCHSKNTAVRLPIIKGMRKCKSKGCSNSVRQGTSYCSTCHRQASKLQYQSNSSLQTIHPVTQLINDARERNQSLGFLDRSTTLPNISRSNDFQTNGVYSHDDIEIENLRNSVVTEQFDVFVVFIPFDGGGTARSKARGSTGTNAIPLYSSDTVEAIRTQGKTGIINARSRIPTEETHGNAMVPGTKEIEHYAIETINYYAQGALSDKRWPDVVFLSEEPKPNDVGHGFPNNIQGGSGRPEYVFAGSLKKSGVSLNAPHLQNIAVYVQKGTEKFYTINYKNRSISGKPETWLVVTKKHEVFSDLQITVAGVHLSSGFTKLTNPVDMQNELGIARNFAQQEQVDAFLGDLNMDSRGLDGGNFLQNVAFDNSNRLYVSVIQSDSNNTRGYMGGLLVSNVIQVAFNIKGMAAAMGRSSMLPDNSTSPMYVSDHPSVAARYQRTFQYRLSDKGVL